MSRQYSSRSRSTSRSRKGRAFRRSRSSSQSPVTSSSSSDSSNTISKKYNTLTHRNAHRTGSQNRKLPASRKARKSQDSAYTRIKRNTSMKHDHRSTSNERKTSNQQQSIFRNNLNSSQNKRKSIDIPKQRDEEMQRKYRGSKFENSSYHKFQFLNKDSSNSNLIDSSQNTRNEILSTVFKPGKDHDDKEQKEAENQKYQEMNQSPISQDPSSAKMENINNKNKYSHYNHYSPKRSTYYNNQKPRQLQNYFSRDIRTREGYKASSQNSIDRAKVAPFLLRVFVKINGEHSLNDFAIRSKEPIQDELQLYFWMDTNLRELVNLVKDVSSESRDRNSFWEFRLIYTDKQGRNSMTEIGSVHSTRINPKIDNKTLQQINFQIGDFIDISINSGRRNRNKILNETNGNLNHSK